ncbi:MAG TPA: hypothetical protein VKZ43_10100 [Trueperaceae bacterium]|nr:hypothetical protein [Trueperaceae bacterium]
MLVSFRLLWLLVLVDVALIVVHVLSARLTTGHLDPAWLAVHRWRVDADGGVAEYFQYLKYVAMIAFAMILYRKCRWRSAPVLSLFALLLLLDDSLRLHERFGEPLGWMVHGCVFFAFWLVARRSGRQQERRLASRLAVLVAALASFAVAVDVLNSRLLHVATGSLLSATLELLADQPPNLLRLVNTLPGWLVAALAAVQAWAVANTVGVAASLENLRATAVGMAVVEDGGEMLALSLLVASLWLEQRRSHAPK